MRIAENRFILINSSGHSELYCDGISHIRIRSGNVGDAPVTNSYEPLKIESKPCNCQRFNDLAA